MYNISFATMIWFVWSIAVACSIGVFQIIPYGLVLSLVTGANEKAGVYPGLFPVLHIADYFRMVSTIP